MDDAARSTQVPVGEAMSHCLHQSGTLADELERCTRRALDLDQELRELQSRVGSETASQGCQTNPSGAPMLSAAEAAQAPTFQFSHQRTKVNWERLKAVNVHRLERETDVATLMTFLDQISHAELESESVYRITSANLVKLFRMSQLMLQYLGYQVTQLSKTRQDTRDEDALLGRMLRGLQSATLGDIVEQTAELEDSCRGLAGPGIEAMLASQAQEEQRAALAAISNQPRQGTPSRHRSKREDGQSPKCRPMARAASDARSGFEVA